MAYDFHGAFDSNSDFMAAMQLDPNYDPTVKDPILKTYNIIDSVAEYKNLGFQSPQIVVGIPAYGRLMKISSLGSTLDYINLLLVLLLVNMMILGFLITNV